VSLNLRRPFSFVAVQRAFLLPSSSSPMARETSEPMSFFEKCRAAWNGDDRSEPPERSGEKVEILVFTPDDRFFSSLLYVTTQFGWTVQWAKSIDRALEILQKRRAISILVYDSWLNPADWPTGVARLAQVSDRTCIVLAAQQVDEGIWERAIGCGAYDVICRAGHAAQLESTLRFASKWSAGRRFPATQSTVRKSWQVPDSNFFFGQPSMRNWRADSWHG
jgi:DNA-binding NtrC family response regulator